jgi:hypothetical protein
MRIHDIVPVFLFDLLLKVTEVRVQNGTFSWHVSLLFELLFVMKHHVSTCSLDHFITSSNKKT